MWPGMDEDEHGHVSFPEWKQTETGQNFGIALDKTRYIHSLTENVLLLP